MQKKYTHWFWAKSSNNGSFYIYTQGLGNHPAGKYFFADLEELRAGIKRLVDDGYQNLSKVVY
jgi:hypothetical protein